MFSNWRYLPPTKEFIESKKKLNTSDSNVINITRRRQNEIIKNTKNKLDNIILRWNISDVIGFEVERKHSSFISNTFLIEQYFTICWESIYLVIDYSNQTVSFDENQLKYINENLSLKKIILNRINKMKELVEFKLFEHLNKNNVKKFHL